MISTQGRAERNQITTPQPSQQKPADVRKAQPSERERQLVDSLTESSRSTLGQARVTLAASDARALEAAIESAARRIFTESHPTPEEAALKRLSEETARLTQIVIAMQRYDSLAYESSSLARLLATPEFGFAVTPEKTTKASSEPEKKKGFGLGNLMKPAMARGSSAAECFSSSQWQRVTELAAASAAALPKGPGDKLRNWLTMIEGKVQPVPDTDIVCIAGALVDNLRTVLKEIGQPTLGDLEELVTLRSNAAEQFSSAAVTAETSDKSVAKVPTQALASLPPSEPRSAGPGIIQRVLSVFCPAYPYC
jgi:hypothetical protein